MLKLSIKYGEDLDLSLLVHKCLTTFNLILKSNKLPVFCHLLLTGNLLSLFFSQIMLDKVQIYWIYGSYGVVHLKHTWKMTETIPPLSISGSPVRRA